MSTQRYDWWKAIRRSDLTPTARHVALTLSTYTDRNGRAWPSMSTLAEDTGRSRSTVKRAVKELVDAGFVVIESGGGRRGDGGYVSNRYLTTAPSGFTSGPPPDSNGSTGDPPPDGLGGSSQHGGGSSREGGGSSQHVRGFTHDPGSSHEVAIQETKQHSAPTERTPNGVEKLSPSGEEEQDQVRDSYRDYGAAFAERLSNKEITPGEVQKLAGPLPDDRRAWFYEGLGEALDQAGAA